DLFRQAEARAREAAARRARLRAEQAHEAAIAARNEAMTDSAPDLAPEPWREAEAQLAAGRSALDRGDSEGSAPTLSQARAIYQRARETAVAVALERARDQALAGRERAATARRVAEAVDAAVLGGEPWAAAEGKLAAGEAALARQRFPRATRQFE